MKRLAAWLAPFVLYVLCAYHTVGYWDVGEMDTVPYILGIAHPPGLPLYTLLGWLFTHALPFGAVAFRMSLFSALAMSLACFCVGEIIRELCVDDNAALAAALLFACGSVAWGIATRADVHAVATLAFTLTVLLILRWYRTAYESDLLLAALAYGLAIAIHPVALCMLPGVLLALVARLHLTPTPALMRASAVCLTAAVLPFAYLPMRSAYVVAHGLDPVAALGMPGGAFWNYDLPSTWSGFFALVGASGIDVNGAFHAYASQSFGASILPFAELLFHEYSFALAGAVAGVILAIRSRDLRVAIVVACAVGSAFFALGFHEESDATRYDLPSFAAIAVLIGYGLSSTRTRIARGLAHAAAAAVILVLLAQSRGYWSQPRDHRALDQANAVLAATPDDAIIVASWVLAPPLAYRAYVDGVTGRRTIVAAWYGETGDVLGRWYARRPVYVVGTPEGSVDGFRLERLTALPDFYRVERATTRP